MLAGVKTHPFLPILKPEKVVNRIIRAIEKDKLFVRTPYLVKWIPFVRGVLPPRVFDWFAGDILNVYKSMVGFAGHEDYNQGKK